MWGTLACRGTPDNEAPTETAAPQEEYDQRQSATDCAASGLGTVAAAPAARDTPGVVVDLRGIRVFIATPGGLDVERRRFRQLLMTLNEDDAHARGVAFIPVGWELSAAGLGRPQEKINDDVRASDYLVLVLWDRWGTPPSIAGPYTSGTEEEYNVARECIASVDHPMRDIVVLFKGVDPKQLSDPGPQLRQVLDFKARLEVDRTLLFSTFDSLEEFERHLRRHLLLWMREEDEGKHERVLAPPPAQSLDGADEPSPEMADTAALLKEAERLTKEGKLTRAESLYARAVVGRTDLDALTQYIRFLRRTGRLDQAMAMSERLFELSRDLGDSTSEIEALSNQAIIRRKLGDNARALRDLNSAVEIAITLGDDGRSSLAFLYDNLGLTLRKSGDFPGSLTWHEKALAIRRQLGDPRGVANASNHLGALLRQQGRVAQAEAMHREALELFREGDGYDRGEAQARANLGEDLQLLGQFAEAREQYELSLALNRELRSPEGIGMNLWQLGRLALAEGRLPDAYQYAHAGLEADDSSGRPEGVAGALHLLGQVELASGRLVEAERSLGLALATYERSGQRLGIAWTALDLARALAIGGRPERANEALARAVSAGIGLGHAQLEEALRAARETVEAQAERVRARAGHDVRRRGTPTPVKE